MAPLRAAELLANALSTAQSTVTYTTPTIGYSFAQAEEFAGVATTTWYGTATDSTAATCWMQDFW